MIPQCDLNEPLGLRDRSILETFYSTGMRRTEFVELTLYSLNVECGTVLIRQGKGRQDRMIPIGEGFTANRMTQLVRNHVKAADLGKTGSCHLFRHTMATLMLEKGADIRFIQAMLGHVKLDTTQIYTQVSIRKLKEIHTATHPAKAVRSSRAEDEHEAPSEDELLASLAAETDADDSTMAPSEKES